jgi:cob(I)alamin adenosyltransferase
VDIGKIQVITGNGKGKTTCAFGLAARAAGHGFKIIIIQFMKSQTNYGELASAKKLGIEVVQFGRPEFVNPKNPDPIDVKMAMDGLEKVKQTSSSGDYDIVIADELNVALHLNMVPFEEILFLIENKNPHTELVITGRYAKNELIEAADLVTEMREIKHYFNAGQGAREGIEY